MNPLDLVRLSSLMELTSGRPNILVGLIDGPVAMEHPDFAGANIRDVSGKLRGTCTLARSSACMHGTFVAGILCAKRESVAPAICPNCTLLVRPIFVETASQNGQMPNSTPEELAAGIIDCIEAGAHVLNLSVALTQPLSSKGQRVLEEALDHAAKREMIIVAAAGNQGTLVSSVITRHPWVIPVVACNLQGKPISDSNLGSSIGRRGLSAPGANITSLGAGGKPLRLGVTSVAAPFVTGAIALLWSAFPRVSAVKVKSLITKAHMPRRATVIPPLLDVWEAYQVMVKTASQIDN